VRWPLPLEALVAVNLVIFLGWLLGSTRWMVKYFEVSARNLIRRPWTLLTASVSHADLYSLIGNFQVSTFPSMDPLQSLAAEVCACSMGLHADLCGLQDQLLMDAVAAMQPHSLMDQGQGLSTAAAFACLTVAAAKLGLVFRKIKMQASCATEFLYQYHPTMSQFVEALETLTCWVSCHFHAD
jgi:hypothetical protein